MDESKKNPYFEKNQLLFEEFKRVFSLEEKKKRVINDFLLLNHGLLAKVVKNSGWQQYQLPEFDDIMQDVIMIYIDFLSEEVEKGSTTYPQIVYPAVLRRLQEHLSIPYGNSGVSIPYASRKVMQKEDWEKTQAIGKAIPIVCEEKSQEHRLEELISSACSKGCSMEDKICNQMVIEEVLKGKSDLIRNIFEDRFFHELTWKEIGEKYAISPDSARYQLKKLAEEIRREIE